ncbi:MAG: 2-hydroxyacid dehydrogenase [Candidatus Deferrimicrobium sp.]
MNEFGKPVVAVSFDLGPEARERIEAVLNPVAQVVHLKDLGPGKRTEVLRESKALLAWAPHSELSNAEQGVLGGIALMQLLSAGADHLDFARIPAGLVVASNVGGYARPMAEHTLAMVLALAKRLLTHHEALKRGIFDQFSENKAIGGATTAILGFGGIGREVARLLKPFGVKILAINRSGKSPEPADFLGTLENLDAVLPKADIVVITLPLTRRTRGLIAKRELELMKPDAILVNVARGEIINERALYEHLKKTPAFMAGIDAWWMEPFRHGRFELGYPFFDLPNVLGTPHNSGLVPGSLVEAVQKASLNILRFLKGEPLEGIVRREDYQNKNPSASGRNCFTQGEL